MVDIKKLPPGKAYGADDLTNWASRRLSGRSGVYDRGEVKGQEKWAKQLSNVAGRRVKPWGENNSGTADRWLEKNDPLLRKKERKVRRLKLRKPSKIKPSDDGMCPF